MSRAGGRLIVAGARAAVGRGGARRRVLLLGEFVALSVLRTRELLRLSEHSINMRISHKHTAHVRIASAGVSLTTR